MQHDEALIASGYNKDINEGRLHRQAAAMVGLAWPAPPADEPNFDFARIDDFQTSEHLLAPAMLNKLMRGECVPEPDPSWLPSVGWDGR